MTKMEQKQAQQLINAARMGIAAGELTYVGYAARGLSALIRASRKSRNELITIAAGIPAIVQHPDFII